MASHKKTISDTTKRRIKKKTEVFSDAYTKEGPTLQEGMVNGRAAILAGLDERYIWVCEREGALTVRSCRTGSVMKSISRTHIFPWSLSEGPGKRTVWVGYSDGCIILFSASPPHNQIRVLEAGQATGGCYCLLHHLDYVFAGYGNCQVIKWNHRTLTGANEGREGYFVGHTGGHGSAVRAMRVDMNCLYTCGDDRAIRKWDISDCKQLLAFKGHDASVLSIAYTKKHHLWSASEDHTVRVWDPESGACIKTFTLDAPIGILRFYGNRIWAGCWDKKIVLFDALNVEKVGLYTNHKAPITDVVCVASTQIFKVWTCGADKCIKVWDMETQDNSFTTEEDERQRLINDLSIEISNLKDQLGHSGRRERHNSCWNIDDVAFCSSQVARSLREKAFHLEADLEAMRAQNAAHQQQIIAQFVDKADQTKRSVCFSKLYKFWASRSAQRARKHSGREAVLLKTINTHILRTFYAKLARHAPYSKNINLALRTCQQLLLQGNHGKMHLAYMALQTYAHQTRTKRTFFEVLCCTTAMGMRRMYYFKLLRYVRGLGIMHTTPLL